MLTQRRPGGGKGAPTRSLGDSKRALPIASAWSYVLWALPDERNFAPRDGAMGPKDGWRELRRGLAGVFLEVGHVAYKGPCSFPHSFASVIVVHLLFAHRLMLL